MKLLRIVVIGMALALASALPALAHASPPDPSWIPGIYDDADYDDVVTLVALGSGNALPSAPIELRFVPRCVETPTIPEAAPEIPGATSNPSRAPPAG